MNENVSSIYATPTNQVSPAFPIPMHRSVMFYPPLLEQSGHTTGMFQHRALPSTQFHPSRFPMSGTKSEKRKQEVLTCDACGIEVNSQQMMDVHIKGQKHIKKMKLKAACATAGRTPEKSLRPETSDETSAEISTESASKSAPDPKASKPVSTPNDKSVLQLLNELAKAHKITAKYDVIQETGPAHCKTFEVRLTLADETYTGIGTSIKRAQQIAAEKALTNTALKKPEAAPKGSASHRTTQSSATAPTPGAFPPARLPQGPVPMRPRALLFKHQPLTPPEENKFHDFLLQRCTELAEDQVVIDMVDWCISEIEKALKVVSDKLMYSCQKAEMPVVPQFPDDVKLNDMESNNTSPDETFRMLKGSLKVSVCSMNLHSKRDNRYCIVVVCANKPNLTLLNDIAQELKVALQTRSVAQLQLDAENKQSTVTTYQVDTPIDQACLDVRCSRLPNHVIQIMLTSPVFRSENYVYSSPEVMEKVDEWNPDPLDMLDKEKCLEAAAEIRHAYWFKHCMLSNQNNLNVLRLLRDLQNQQTPLSCLSLWCLVLLVHVSQIQHTDSIVAAFRSVFACLSSGLLLPNGIGSGLVDPCEKTVVEATEYLSIDERLAITTYAQTVLRLIAFEQYDQIFAASASLDNQMDNPMQ